MHTGNTGKNQKTAHQTTGAKIMQLADLIRPALLEKLQGCHDEHDMPVQPERVRGLALVIARNIIIAREAKAG